MIHSETTTGILNDIQSIGELAKTYHKVFIVDAMSSFAGVDIPMHDWHIDFLVSSANKCIQGVPGFSFIIARRELLIASRVEKAVQGPIITTFLYPDTDFDFAQMYRFIKERGYAIYPGKLTDKDTFRIGTIGEIYEEDILRLAQIMKEYMESRGN